MTEPTGRLAAILRGGGFGVTGEIVPPRGGSGVPIADHARGLVGYIDAVNLTDNPTATAHMSPLAGVRFAAEAGIEPTVQLTVRDRNRLGITADLLGAWALGARNVFCLSGDPIAIGDHPDATPVADLGVHDVVALARRMREEGTTLAGGELDDPPRYLIGVAELPFAEPYDPSRLDVKLDAGADFVHDPDRLRRGAPGRMGRRDAPARAVRTREGGHRRDAAAEREAGAVHGREAAGGARAPRDDRGARAGRRRRGGRRARPDDPASSRRSAGSTASRAST